MTQHVYFDQAPPRSWDQFEELCADTFQEEWRDASLVRHGRAGQRQHGVDIVGRDGALWPIGLQCKKKLRWPVAKVTTKDLEAEVDKAKEFEPALKSFYLVSTAPDDEALQRKARLITEKHQKEGLFSVNVIGWGELVRRATKHQVVAAKHFGSYSSHSASPLLATWRASHAKLLLDDDELAVNVFELIHDFREFPEGRIVFRQAESEDLLSKIKEKQAVVTAALDKRKNILKLRDRLKTEKDREARVTKGLRLLLAYEALADSLAYVWEDHVALLVRSFVEQGIDPNFGNVTGLEKIRLRLPGAEDDQWTSIFVPPHVLNDIWDHSVRLKNKWNPDLPTNNIGELPADVQFRYAIPAVVRRSVSEIDRGMTAEQLDKHGWFNMYNWRIRHS